MPYSSVCTSKVNLLGLTRLNVCLLYSVEKPVSHSITGSWTGWTCSFTESQKWWARIFLFHACICLGVCVVGNVWQCLKSEVCASFYFQISKRDAELLHKPSETDWGVCVCVCVCACVRASKPHSLVGLAACAGRLSGTAFLMWRNRRGETGEGRCCAS